MADLPEILPIFPLTGSLLLPGNWLPLQIFEPRYRCMVEDAYHGQGEGEGSRMLGMIQPLTPQDDNRVDLSTVDFTAMERQQPALYQVGCAGRIEEYQKVAEGRFLVALVGVSRFRIREELPLKRGYRRVLADYGDFDDDSSEAVEAEAAPSSLIDSLTEFGALHGLTFDMKRLAKLPCRALVNGLAMALPFDPPEKQALLEADNLQRLEVLQALLRMGVDLRGDEGNGESVPN